MDFHSAKSETAERLSFELGLVGLGTAFGINSYSVTAIVLLNTPTKLLSEELISPIGHIDYEAAWKHGEAGKFHPMVRVYNFSLPQMFGEPNVSTKDLSKVLKNILETTNLFIKKYKLKTSTTKTAAMLFVLDDPQQIIEALEYNVPAYRFQLGKALGLTFNQIIEYRDIPLDMLIKSFKN